MRVMKLVQGMRLCHCWKRSSHSLCQLTTPPPPPSRWETHSSSQSRSLCQFTTPPPPPSRWETHSSSQSRSLCQLTTPPLPPRQETPVELFLLQHPQIKMKRNVPQLFDIFSKSGLEHKTISDILINFPDILSSPPNKISDSLEAWFQCQLGNKVSTLFVEFPFLLLIDKQDILQRYMLISALFNHKNTFRIIRNSPSIMTENWDLILEKLEYLENELKYSRSEICSKGALACSLGFLKMRFEFLKICGHFKTPNPKLSQAENPVNPTLTDILRMEDDQFAVKLATVTPLEFQVFQQMHEESDEEDE